MTSHRDEAVDARGLAKRLFLKQDYHKSMGYARKAQELSPTLEGSQMLAVLQVVTAAQSKLEGTEMDWYGMLQVNPAADHKTIKKAHDKLAMLLHPDKNKGVGAAEAFIWLTEAWNILKDQEKKAVYDRKLAILEVLNGTQKTLVRMGANERNSSQNPGMYWTECPRCTRQEQIPIRYKNYAVACPTCGHQHVAREIHNFCQDFCSNKQPASAVFDGAPDPTRSTNVQTDENAETKTVGREKEKKRKEAEKDGLQKEDTDMKKSRKAESEGKPKPSPTVEESEGAATATSKPNVDVGRASKLEGKKRDSTEKGVLDVEDSVGTKRAKLAGDAKPKDAVKSEERAQRQQAKFDTKGKSAVAEHINAAKWGTVKNGREVLHRRTNFTGRRGGGGDHEAANLNPSFGADAPAIHNREIFSCPKCKVEEQRQRRYKNLLYRCPKHEFVTTAAGDGVAVAADYNKNYGGLRPVSRSISDEFNGRRDSTPSNAEDHRGPASPNSSFADPPATTRSRLAFLWSVAVPLLLTSELLRTSQVLLTRNESQLLADVFFFLCLKPRCGP